MTYLAAIFIISTLIVVHELGHLLAARASGIAISKFSLGFGRRICGFRAGGTEFQLSLIPLGGYVMVAASDEKEYLSIKLWKRLTMSLGGPVANMLLPVLLFSTANLIAGKFTVSALLIEPIGRTVAILMAMLVAIGQLFTGNGDVSGVVGIVAAGGKMISSLAAGAMFASLISLNLAIVNLLPLPPLDGGKIVLDTLTTLRPAWKKAYVPACLAGWIAMAGLMIYATAMDVARCVTA